MINVQVPRAALEERPLQQPSRDADEPARRGVTSVFVVDSKLHPQCHLGHRLGALNTLHNK